MLQCTNCRGKGSITGISPTLGARGKNPVSVLPCKVCDGTGKISIEKFRWIVAGRAMRRSRYEKRITFIDAARQMGIPAVYLLEMEAGIRKPIGVKQ